METLLKHLLVEVKLTKFEKARVMIKPMLVNGRFTPEEIMDRMVRNLKIKDSTADTYYHMIAKEFAGKDEEEADGVDLDAPEEDEVGDPALEDEDTESVDGEDELSMDLEDELEDGQFRVEDDPKRQGVIRRVKGAHLVYKRENDAGLFDELWIYNTEQKIGSAQNIKKDILAATDIPPRATQSEDGSQKYSLTVLGDVSMLHISNLPQ